MTARALLQSHSKPHQNRPILHIIAGLDIGGAEMMLTRLVRVDGRHRHVVVSLGGRGALAGQLEEANVAVFALGMNKPLGMVTALPRLALLIRRLRPKLIQGWMNHGNLVATLAAAAARGKCPVVWNIRQSLSPSGHDKWLTRRIIAANARLSGRAAAIVYNSRAGAAQHAAAGYGNARSCVIPNGFDLEVFAPSPVEQRLRMRRQLGIAESEVAIGMIARFDRWKNHRVMFDAAARLIAAQLPVRFVFAGSGMSLDNKQVRSQINDPALLAKALFLGQRTDVPQLMSALDIAVNVSHGEGFPNTVAEAMACGIPCVVTDVGESAHIVGETGIVCRGDGPRDIAEALEQLVRAGPEERRRRGEQARERVATLFSLPAIVNQYDALYESLTTADQPFHAQAF